MLRVSYRWESEYERRACINFDQYWISSIFAKVSISFLSTGRDFGFYTRSWIFMCEFIDNKKKEKTIYCNSWTRDTFTGESLLRIHAYASGLCANICHGISPYTEHVCISTIAAGDSHMYSAKKVLPCFGVRKWARWLRNLPDSTLA